MDYDYDSEGEWEEPGEGEDLDSEGEEEIESEDGDDMEGFLDDEDVADSAKALQKRRLVTGDLEPISTGLCWEDDNNYQAHRDLAQFQLEVILGKSFWGYNVESHLIVQQRTQQHLLIPTLPHTGRLHHRLPSLHHYYHLRNRLWENHDYL